MTIPVITIGRNEWALSSEENAKPIIKTGRFWNDTIVTFSADKWAIMARIGNDTELDTIEKIFNKIKEINNQTYEGVNIAHTEGASTHTADMKKNLITKKLSELLLPVTHYKMVDDFDKTGSLRGLYIDPSKSNSDWGLDRLTVGPYDEYIEIKDYCEKKDLNTKPLVQVTEINLLTAEELQPCNEPACVIS